MSLDLADPVIVIDTFRDLHGHYLRLPVLIRTLSSEDAAEGIVCRALDADDDDEIGVLVISAAGKILFVRVDPAHRRRGIATQMLKALRESGHTVTHDWDDMREDGAVWARAVDGGA